MYDKKTAVLWVVAENFMPGQYEVQGSFSFLGPGTRASAPETVSYGTSEQALLLSGCKMRVNGNGTSLYEPWLG